MARLYERASLLLKPVTRTTPDEWARNNREYPPSSGKPGPRRPELTPYMIPFARSVHGRTHKRVVMAMFAQGGKSEAFLDVIGERLDTSPVPILYVGPTQQMIREQWEPRIMQLLDEAPSLRRKVARGKRMTKTKKVISGVPLRLAHGGSSSALKSDSFGLCLTDEADEMVANVKGQGNPIDLIDLRGDTYDDFVHAIISTPSKGPSEVVVDEESGLEFWADPDDPKEIESTIWKLWLSGSRHHWAWPCPHCGEYFIPRFRCLAWEKPRDADGKELPSTPAHAAKTAHLVCPRNGCIIEDDSKADMNARGVYVAPGQSVAPDGTVHGAEPESWTVSYWASGLASPFKTWGERAATYVEAVRSGDSDKVQAVINGGFGEVFAPGSGDAPEWMELEQLRLPYAPGDLPEGVLFTTMGVDVQPNRLIYVIRGWGLRQESWLIDNGEIWGDTAFDDPWLDLSDVIEAGVQDRPIRRVFVDSGFRPGKRDIVPEHRVYDFCRRNSRFAYATKGMSKKPVAPLSVKRIDVTAKGDLSKYGLDLVRLDPDFFKSWVHQRIRWPQDQPGAWHLHQDVTESYCRQVVSEARLRKPSGGATWVQRSRENHYLDAEALAYAAAYMLGVQRLVERGEQPKADRSSTIHRAAPPEQAKATVTAPVQTIRQSAVSALAGLNRPRGAI